MTKQHIIGNFEKFKKRYNDMAGINCVTFIGHLGKDPEVRHLDNGKAVTNFSLATSETFKNKAGEKQTSTEWHNIVLWTPLAEIAEKYLSKGSQIYLEGKLTHRAYDDKDGNKRYITEVVGKTLTMLGSKGNTERVAVTVEDQADNLPF